MSAPMTPLRVSIIGAECTGKTTLAAALAARLPALHLPEYLREFCAANGRTPRPDEQAGLLREQIAREAHALEKASREGLAWVLCDSVPLATALYSIELFGDDSLLPEAIAHHQGYALTLWTGLDPVWQGDGIQRDGPAARAAFHARLGETLVRHGIAHQLIQGDLDARAASAVSWLRAYPGVESAPR